jgi:hypothetical protein
MGWSRKAIDRKPSKRQHHAKIEWNRNLLLS